MLMQYNSFLNIVKANSVIVKYCL